ncbi:MULTISPECIES: MarR family winged helix-turn-helix transcriptional regulator [Fredinandcohnia]|uniref:MarR family winged helix-turn-helix transcriptional regulator n=1 Tax=Fredinandcohnia salidurans TaxID=2595041 RepID=A0ABW4ML98_9BACI|nr:MarR family transcriptional regulator [Fredinandcohnia onubensis]
MAKTNIKELVDLYVDVSFSVNTIADSLVKEQLGTELTNEQHYTLRYINKVGSCTSTELAEVFEVKKSAITAIINRLFEKGLIDRTRDENDRRLVYLTLSTRGEKLFLKTEERVNNLVESIIGEFSEEEIVQFLKTYEKLNGILQKIKQNKVVE